MYHGLTVCNVCVLACLIFFLFGMHDVLFRNFRALNLALKMQVVLDDCAYAKRWKHVKEGWDRPHLLRITCASYPFTC